jgi:ankyrin repeat protein
MEDWFNVIQINNIYAVKEFINQSIDVNMEDIVGNSGLIYSVIYNRKEIVKLLLKQPNININFRNHSGDTALILSIFWEYYDISQLLLERNEIDVNIKNDEGYNFIDFFNDKSFLINYKLQKEILKNGREDILIFLNNSGLINDKIKEENIELFQANIWGLI